MHTSAQAFDHPATSGRTRPPTRAIAAIRSLLLAALGSLLLAGGPASAHPHVWVTMASEFIYGADGLLTGVRHAWTFDETFSSFALLGLKGKKKGEFTRDELAPLAEVNVASLKDYGYFTSAKVGGARKRGLFGDPVDYWLAYDAKDSTLTLHFMLPLKTPFATKDLDIQVYDPQFFVAFDFAEKDPIKSVGAPPQCKASIVRPHDWDFVQGLRRDRSQTAAEANAGMGARFANTIALRCP